MLGRTLREVSGISCGGPREVGKIRGVRGHGVPGPDHLTRSAWSPPSLELFGVLTCGTLGCVAHTGSGVTTSAGETSVPRGCGVEVYTGFSITFAQAGSGPDGLRGVLPFERDFADSLPSFFYSRHSFNAVVRSPATLSLAKPKLIILDPPLPLEILTF